MNLKGFENLYQKNPMPVGLWKVLQSKHLLLFRNLTENKWLNMLQTNKPFCLQWKLNKVWGYRPTALMVTAADEEDGGSRAGHSNSGRSPPRVHFSQSDKSSWSTRLSWTKKEFRGWCVCILKDTNNSLFLFNWIQRKETDHHQKSYDKPGILWKWNDCKQVTAASSVLPHIKPSCADYQLCNRSWHLFPSILINYKH